MIKQYSPKFRMSKSYSLLVTLGNISFSWLVLFLLFLNTCILLVCSTKDKHTNAQLNKYWAGNEPCFATAPGGISKKTKSVNSIFRCSWITGSHSATELNWLSMLKNVFNHSEYHRNYTTNLNSTRTSQDFRAVLREQYRHFN